jgi:hypothetical protein
MYIKLFIVLLSLIYSSFAGIPCIKCAISREMYSSSLEITQERPCDDKLVLEYTCGSCYTGHFDFTKLLSHSKDDALLYELGCQKNLKSKKPYEYYEPISIYFRRLIFEYAGGNKALSIWEINQRNLFQEYRPFWNIRAIRFIHTKVGENMYTVFRSLHDYIVALKGNIKYCLVKTDNEEKIYDRLQKRENDAKKALKDDPHAIGLFEDVYRNLSPDIFNKGLHFYFRWFFF